MATSGRYVESKTPDHHQVTYCGAYFTPPHLSSRRFTTMVTEIVHLGTRGVHARGEIRSRGHKNGENRLASGGGVENVRVVVH